MVRAKLTLCVVSLFMALQGAADGAGGSSAEAARLPKLFTQEDGHTFRIRPKVVRFTGDGTGVVAGNGSSVRHPGRIRWKRWTKRSAYGVGRVWINDCDPTCAEGHFHPDRGSIRANRARRGRFRHLIVRFRENGHRYTDYSKLRHVPRDRDIPGYWYWGYAAH